MFYGQCNACGERWGLGTASTCTCPQPDRWVGLTEEEIDELARTMIKSDKSVNWLVAAIEAKLKEKNAA